MGSANRHPNEYVANVDGTFTIRVWSKGEWFAALIDADDVERVRSRQWRVQRARGGGRYVQTDARKPDGRWSTLLLHRLLTDAPANMDVDHVSGDGLDNRQANLRVCTTAENLRNNRQRLGTTGERGVRPNGRGFAARVKVDGRWHSLGTYPTIAEAAAARRAAEESVDPVSYALARKRNGGNP